MIKKINTKNLSTTIISFQKFFFKRISFKEMKLYNDYLIKFYKKKTINNILSFNFDKKRKISFSLFKNKKNNIHGVLNYNEHILCLLFRYIYDIHNYKKIADIGSNLGFHTVFLDKIGYKVDSYEPDPNTFKLLKKNIQKNRCAMPKLYNLAVYNKKGILNFTRVVDHLMASHITGNKTSYGSLEYIKVKTINIRSIIKKYDLIKLDVEGSESKIISELKNKDLKNKEIICEITDFKNQKIVFDHCKKNKILIFSSKINWCIVKKYSQMPINHNQGFIVLSLNKYFFKNIKQKL